MKKILLLLCLFWTGMVSAGSGWSGWQVNEVYTNQTASVQYIELVADASSNQNISGSWIHITTDFDTHSFRVTESFNGAFHYLIANQGFAQSPGSVPPNLIVQGQLFDPASMTLQITLDNDNYIFDPLDIPDDDFYALYFDMGIGVNTPTNAAGNAGQLYENPIFQSDFEFCGAPILQFRDWDNDNHGNAFDSLLACQLKAGYVEDNTDCNDNDSNIYPGNIDNPDLAYIDSNCDGIDGDRNNSIFVVSGASGSGLTAADPTGDAYAAQQLALNNNRAWALIESGVYPVGTVNDANLLPGVNLAGKYINDFESRFIDPINFQTQLSTPYHGAKITAGVNGQTFQHIRFGGGGTPASETNYALTVQDSDINLQRVFLIAASGGDGADGVPGSMGSNGSDGSFGGAGVENDDGFSCSSGSAPSRGAGGLSSCNQAGGRGGAAGLGSGWGSSGSAAEFFGGAGGAGGAGDGSPSTRDGSNGSDGNDGMAGTNGMHGVNVIEFINNEYVPSSGSAGTDGSNGRGGGGGGGGGGGAFLCDSYGGGGGGGGSGGCGGTAGSGGGGGGASVALRLINSHVQVIDSDFLAQNGGDGGTRGLGGPGGSGRFGRAGGPGEDDSGAGGRGGHGGDGGRGGHGGSGAGGAVIGVACLGTSTLIVDQDTTFQVANPGIGGSGAPDGQVLETYLCDSN